MHQLQRACILRQRVPVQRVGRSTRRRASCLKRRSRFTLFLIAAVRKCQVRQRRVTVPMHMQAVVVAVVVAALLLLVLMQYALAIQIVV